MDFKAQREGLDSQLVAASEVSSSCCRTETSAGLQRQDRVQREDCMQREGGRVTASAAARMPLRERPGSRLRRGFAAPALAVGAGGTSHTAQPAGHAICCSSCRTAVHQRDPAPAAPALQRMFTPTGGLPLWAVFMCFAAPGLK